MSKLKCTNPTCSYGPRMDPDDIWDLPDEVRTERREVVAGIQIVPEGLRCDAYSQNRENHAAGRPNYGGLCLNCIDDERRDADLGDYDRI